MQTFQNGITKQEFVAELKKHQEMDNFISGKYEKVDDNGQFKGCAIGCSLESIARLKGIKLDYSNHQEMENHGIAPIWLAKVEDVIFEGVSDKRKKSWPVEFAEAIPENVDLDPVKAKFLICVLESVLTCFDHDVFPDVKNVIDTVINLWKNGGTNQEFKDTALAAALAVLAAEAADAVRAVRAIHTALAAALAVLAVRAVRTALTDGRVYLFLDVGRAAALAALAAARVAKFEYFADQLLIMIKECK